MKRGIVAGALSLTILLSGCGSLAGRHSIDSGFAYIESHEYTSALESFEEAEKNGEDACLIHRGKGIAYLYSGEYEQAAEELLSSLASDEGIVDDMDFDAALLAAQQGKSDIVMAGVSVTEERQKVMEFSDSYATGVQVIIVKEDSEIASVEDLEGKMIGTQRGTTGNIYCTDDYGEDHITTYDNGLTAVQALMNGQVDCVVIDQEPAKAFVAANQGLKILETEYVSEDYAIGMAKGNTALQSAVNKALAELQEDGTVQSIVDKYIAAK